MDKNKKIAKNTLFLYLRMFLVMGISLYTSRIVLETLGIVDFGIYNIVGSTVLLFSFLSTSLTIAVQRYLAYALGIGDLNKFRLLFSQAFWVYLILSLFILIIAETVGLSILYNYIDIPEGRFRAAFWTYQYSIFTFIIGIIRLPYNAAILAYEKMSFFAYTGIVEVFLKLLITYLLVILAFDKLISYSVLLLGVSVVISIWYHCYCFKNLNGCKLKFSIDKSVINELAKFSGWSMLSSASSTLTNQGVNILLNNFFGVLINAANGISVQIMNALSQFLVNFQMAFNPQIIKSYANGDYKYLRSLIFRASLISFYLMILIAIPLMTKMDYILSLWLKTVPEYACDFSICIIISFLMESYAGPLWMTVQAVGKIKRYQIIISSLYLLNILGSFVFLYAGYSPLSVFIIRIIISVIVFFARVFLLNFLLKFSVRDYFLKVMLKSYIIFIVLFFISYHIGLHLHGFWGLILFIIISVSISSTFIFCCGFEKTDRDTVIRIILKRVGR